MYDPDYIRHFYDLYGVSEWLRFEDSAYGRLQGAIHSEFLRRYIGSNHTVIDVGCGPGRFSIQMAEQGARVTLLDISPTQLALARENLAKAGQLGQVGAFIEDDVTNPSSQVEPGRFDAVVCFGGVLAYAYDKRQAAAESLLRLCKTGGLILVSVPSRFGNVATIVRQAKKEILDKPDEKGLWRIMNEGNLPGWHSGRIGINHPPMHLYSSDEVVEIFKPSTLIEMIGSPVTAFEGQESLEALASDPARWECLLELERRMGGEPGMVDSGSFILAAFRRGD